MVFEEGGLVSDDIQVERQGPVEWIVFNRPQVGNAIRDETLQDLCAALDAAITDPQVRAIVLAANGKHFVAGAEFSTLERINDMSVAQVQTEIYSFAQGAARRIFNCPKPTIAALQGAAMTVGCELALSCDFRVVTDCAKLQENWIRLGAMPPLGGLKLLPALIGLARAKNVVLRGLPISGAQAVEIGLAVELTSFDGLRAVTQALALELAAISPNAYREAKVGLHRGLDSHFENELLSCGLAQATLLTSEDFGQRLAAVKAARARPA
jgi:enoyl-CoA hydratase/carnithine racemase